MDLNGFVNIVGLLAMIITWFIVSPLKEAITTLQKLVEKLSNSLEDRREELYRLGERVAAGETTIEKTARDLEHLKDEFHGFCKNCKCGKD